MQLLEVFCGEMIQLNQDNYDLLHHSLVYKEVFYT